MGDEAQAKPKHYIEAAIIEWCKQKGFADRLGDLEHKRPWVVSEAVELAQAIGMGLRDLVEAALRAYDE